MTISFYPSSLSLTSFLRFCKDFPNLLFWIIQAGLAIPTKTNGINLEDSLLSMNAKKQLHPFLLFGDIAKILQTCYFGYFDHVWLWPVKMVLPAWRNFWCLSSCKKKSHLFLSSWTITKILRIWYFGCFGHAWLSPSNVIAETYRKL